MLCSITYLAPGLPKILAAVVCAVAAGFMAPAALAQDEGVFVDPGSPSGKEYALPLDTARREADPTRDPDAPVRAGSRSSPLFGSGVASSTTERGEPGAEGGRNARGDAPTGVAAPTTSEQDQEALRMATGEPGAPEAGADIELLVAGVGLLVLLVGALAGYAARRMSRIS